MAERTRIGRLDEKGYKADNAVIGTGGVCNTLLTTYDGRPSGKGFKVMDGETIGLEMVGKVGESKLDMANRVYSEEDLSPTITAICGGNQERKVLQKWRIRKLTPCECGKLMGFDRDDFEAMEGIGGLSKATLYHSAGDSIVTTVLMGLFGEILGVEGYERKIEETSDRVASEKGEKGK